MPAATTKKASGAAKPKPTSNHASYQDMITDGIMNLKDRNGSSRQALKKYVRANNNITVSDNMFDSLFNKSLKSGVDKGVFEQPKGPSGGTKLAKKKPAAAPAEKKPAAEKKAAAPKKATATKAAATKKAPAAKKAAAPKKATTTKAAATKKAPAAKKAAPAAKKAAPKKAATKKAPAVPAKAEKPETVLTKTKSGRVAKVQKAAPAKKAAPKRAAPKKAKA